MAALKIYNKLESEPIETHVIDGSLIDWVKKNCPSYNENVNVFTAKLNGMPFDYTKNLTKDDNVDLVIEPKGEGVVYIVVAILSAAYSYYVTSKLQDFQRSRESGDSLYNANARLNNVQPSGVIREVAGSITFYPDYVKPSFRRFEDDLEILYIHMAVCADHIDLAPENFYIAETPLSNYESEASINIYDPGESFVASDRATQFWYESKEVAGLELKTGGSILEGNWSFDYTESEITSKLDGVVAEFPFGVDADFQIEGGSNPGYYRVTSLSGANNETARVIGLVRSNGDTGRLEILSQQVSLGFRPGAGIRVNTFSSTGTALLLDASDETPALVRSINGAVNWEGWFAINPEGERTNLIELDFFFPQGLAENNNGEPQNRILDVEVQWREKGTTEPQGTVTFRFDKGTFDQVGETILLGFGNIEPEIRIRRVTKEPDTIDITDRVELTRIKSRLESPVSYPDLTTATLRLVGTNTFSSTSENRVNIRGATKKLPTIDELETGSWDLSGSNPAHSTRSVMRWCAWMLQKHMPQKYRTQIDWDRFRDLDALLESRGDFLDAEFKDETTLWEALKIALSAGYCEPSIRDGRFHPARVAQSSSFEHVYTPDIMLGEGLQVDHAHFDDQDVDGVDVEYFSTETNSMEVVECRAPGDLGVNPLRIQSIGITDRTRAWRWGMRERNRKRFKPATYTFNTEMDAFNSHYGDRIGVFSDLFDGQYGAVTTVIGNELELDFEPDLSQPIQYWASVRNLEGKAVASQVSAGSQPNRIVFGPLGFVPFTDGSADPAYVSIGSEQEFIKPAIVRKVTPSGETEAQITAEEYLDEVYQDDDNFPPS